MTTRTKKDVQLAQLTENLRRAKAVMLTDYRGFSVQELADLRKQLQPQQVQYVVAKNTLIRRAAAALNLDDPGQMLAGPTALAFLYGDLQAPARTLTDLSKARKPLPIKAVIVGKQFAGPAAAAQLASLPPRDQLYAQVVGGIASPLAGLVGVLHGTVASLAHLLQARVQQLGGAPE